MIAFLPLSVLFSVVILLIAVVTVMGVSARDFLL